MEKLAIFDVDYTLTNRETLIQFYLFMVKNDPRKLKHIFTIIKAALFYLFKIYNLKELKEYFISFINGVEEKKMQDIVKTFYEQKLSKIIYNDALDMMKRLKKMGYKIYLISASPEFYLNELYKIKEVDKVIGTRYRLKDGIYEGKMEGENCKGEEKVKRLLEFLNSEGIKVDFKNSYMFSDSLSDLPLFNLVGNPYLINYNKSDSNKINILRWK